MCNTEIKIQQVKNKNGDIQIILHTHTQGVRMRVISTASLRCLLVLGCCIGRI